MTSVPGVEDVHDLHVWSITSGIYALSCHALIDDLPPSESASILNALETMLSGKYQIGHATIQFECHPHQERYCAVNGLYCQMEADDCHDHDHSTTSETSVEQKGHHEWRDTCPFSTWLLGPNPLPPAHARSAWGSGLNW